MKSNDGILDAWHGCVSSTYTKLIQSWQILDTTSIISQMEVTKWWTRLKALTTRDHLDTQVSSFHILDWHVLYRIDLTFYPYITIVSPLYHDCSTLYHYSNPILRLFKPYITTVPPLYHFFLSLYHDCSIAISRLCLPYPTISPSLYYGYSTPIPRLFHTIPRLFNPYTTIC